MCAKPVKSFGNMTLDRKFSLLGRDRLPLPNLAVVSDNFSRDISSNVEINSGYGFYNHKAGNRLTILAIPPLD